VAIPPAAKFGTGSLPVARDDLHQLVRRLELLRARRDLLGPQRRERADLAGHRAQVAHRLDDVAAARLALGADHRRALADPPQRLAEIARAAHERRAEVVLRDVVLLVRRGQHLALVDEVDAERLEHARLEEVADPHLRHHRDRDRALDALDHLDAAHARDAALLADVGGHALERHHRGGARLLGDLRLLGFVTSMITPPLSISASPTLISNDCAPRALRRCRWSGS
jgi:hypothetical protein